MAEKEESLDRNLKSVPGELRSVYACVCVFELEASVFLSVEGREAAHYSRAEDPGAWMIDGGASLREQEGIEARSQVVGLVFARRRDIASTEK